MGVHWSTAPTGRSSATRPQTSLARIGTSPASHCAAARSPEVKPFGVPTPQTVTLSIVEDPVLELVLQLRQEQWLSRSRNADREPWLRNNEMAAGDGYTYFPAFSPFDAYYPRDNNGTTSVSSRVEGNYFY